MKKVLIYSGTTEGRTLAQTLAKLGFECDVCVATEYGKMVMDEAPQINILQGRLDVEQMRELAAQNHYDAIVDATHPFATIVSENIRKSLVGVTTLFYRLSRDLDSELTDICRCFDSVEECVEALKSFPLTNKVLGESEASTKCACESETYAGSTKCACESETSTKSKGESETPGRILLTTGSKDLHIFCQDEQLKKSLVARVLPGKESIDICYECGLEGKQIIGMQGPFSLEMNLAMIKQYNIKCIVTKESGKVGGVDEKIQAAKAAGIPCFLIRRPVQNSCEVVDNNSVQMIVCGSVEEVCENIAGVKHDNAPTDNHEMDNNIEVALIGIGMGTDMTLTKEASEFINSADYIFGAQRMIENYTAKVSKYPYYLQKDILPCLEKIHDEACESALVKVAILFSGDTGFYSGCEKLYKALLEVDYVSAKIMPGISSIVELSSKIGISWQDAAIVSTHGIKEKVWAAKIIDSVKHNKKTFFLTSGPEDVRRIAEILSGLEIADGIKLFLGYQLSYDDEKIYELTTDNCDAITEQGLYVGMAVNENFVSRRLGPGLRDEDFIRDKVPMTKEEVREISICKLGLREGSVVYDIGSGTGSIAVEMGLLAPSVSVYAIETEPLAVELILENVANNNLYNVNVIEAMAPEGLENLPVPTHAFIGGSKGNLKEILDVLYEKNNKMRVVANAISLETICQLQELMKQYPIANEEITQVSVSKAKKLGDYNLMQANNPVYIFAFDFCEGL